MWQKKTKINVIPINVTVNILLIKHQPKMDDLLVANAYKNETTGMDTGSLWKIIQTSPKNRSPSHLRGSNFKALSGGKRGVLDW